MAEVDPNDLLRHYCQKAMDLEFELVKHQLALRRAEEANEALQQALEESSGTSELRQRLSVPDPTPETP